jgi:hypothetical protein
VELIKKFFAFLIGALLTGLAAKLVIDHFIVDTSPLEWWQIAALGGIFVLGQAFIGIAFSRRGALFVIELISVVAMVIFLIIQGRQGNRVQNAAQKVCAGTGLSTAAPYNPTVTGLHPIVLYYPFNGNSPKEEEYPNGWLPKEETNLQLVACLNEEWLTLQTCQYSDNTSAIRQQHQVTIEVHSTQTAELVKTMVLKGGQPPACAGTTQAKATPSRTFVGGEAVSLSAIIQQLTPLVAP